jgi:hypothetical protein
MYIRHLNSNKCQSFEEASASKIFITNTDIECRHGYFQKDTAVVIIKAEYDYDSKTYLVTLRDLHHNKDKFRIESSEEKFKELFRVAETISKKYREYRDSVENYYTENVKAFDTITTLAMITTIVALIGGALLTVLILNKPLGHMGVWWSSKLLLMCCSLELFAFIAAIILWLYKLYMKHIKKKDNWGGMLDAEHERREQLADEVERILSTYGE